MNRMDLAASEILVAEVFVACVLLYFVLCISWFSKFKL
jgi:hypothetical protein